MDSATWNGNRGIPRCRPLGPNFARPGRALFNLLRQGDTACSAGGELVSTGDSFIKFCFNRLTGSRLAVVVLVLVLVSLGCPSYEPKFALRLPYRPLSGLPAPLGRNPIPGTEGAPEPARQLLSKASGRAPSVQSSRSAAARPSGNQGPGFRDPRRPLGGVPRNVVSAPVPGGGARPRRQAHTPRYGGTPTGRPAGHGNVVPRAGGTVSPLSAGCWIQEGEVQSLKGRGSPSRGGVVPQGEG